MTLCDVRKFSLLCGLWSPALELLPNLSYLALARVCLPRG